MNQGFQFLVYRSAEEDVSVDAIIKEETIWLTQKAMAELFGVQTPAISRHLKNIFEAGELDEIVVVSKMEITTAHGAMPDKTPASIYEFLAFRKYEILPDKGTISKQIAAAKAEAEYAEFNKTQKITSDFDRAVKQLAQKEAGDDDEQS